MNFRYMHRVVYLSLVSIFLLAQTAQAMHDVEHQTHVDTELCQLFAHSDHSSCPPNEIVSLSVEVIKESFFLSYSSVSFEQIVSHFQARGPPSTYLGIT